MEQNPRPSVSAEDPAKLDPLTDASAVHTSLAVASEELML